MVQLVTTKKLANHVGIPGLTVNNVLNALVTGLVISWRAIPALVPNTLLDKLTQAVLNALAT